MSLYFNEMELSEKTLHTFSVSNVFRTSNQTYNSLDDYLLNDRRTIYLRGSITSEMASNIFIAIEYLNTLGNNPITLYIDSPGGSVIAGNTIIEAMQLSKSTIYTINVGLAASMAATILIYGDVRSSLPRAETMLHQTSIGTQKGSTSFKQIETTYNLLQKTMDQLFEGLKLRTRIPDHLINTFFENDKWLNSQECLEYGIIDSIVSIPLNKVNNKNELSNK